MVKRSQDSQVFIINSSLFLVKGLVLIHLLALFAAYQNSLEISVKVFIIILICISSFYSLQREFERQSFSIRYNDVCGWGVALSGQQFININILPSTVLTSHLIFFHYKTQQMSKQTILICNDALVEGDYRKLMVQMKISGLKSFT